MSAAPVARFGSAGEIDAWVAEHFPAQNRQWKDNLKTYLREIAKEQRANCKAGDGPSLQACCAHLALNPFSFQTFVNSTNRLKKNEWAEHILDRLLAYRSSKVPLADTLSATSVPREWCTDGVAASSSAPGIVGPVQAFRGEIEAQGRGSLHPHILVWLIGIMQRELLCILEREPGAFKQRLAEWMRCTVLAVQSTCQSSVKALPQQFGNVDAKLKDLPFSRVERKITGYDGGSEHDALRAAASRGLQLSETQEAELETGDPASWLRPCLPIRNKPGAEVAGNAPDPPRESVYSKRLNEFAASSCPSFRRMGTVRLASKPANSCASSQPDGADAGVAEVNAPGADAWSCALGRTCGGWLARSSFHLRRQFPQI